MNPSERGSISPDAGAILFLVLLGSYVAFTEIQDYRKSHPAPIPTPINQFSPADAIQAYDVVECFSTTPADISKPLTKIIRAYGEPTTYDSNFCYVVDDRPWCPKNPKTRWQNVPLGKATANPKPICVVSPINSH